MSEALERIAELEQQLEETDEARLAMVRAASVSAREADAAEEKLATAKAALELIYATYGALPAGLIAKWGMGEKLVGRAEPQILEDCLLYDDGLPARIKALALYRKALGQIEQE